MSWLRRRQGRSHGTGLRRAPQQSALLESFRGVFGSTGGMTDLELTEIVDAWGS